VTFISVTTQASLQIYTIYTILFNHIKITFEVYLLFIPIILTLQQCIYIVKLTLLNRHRRGCW